jgi:hypothetical protein
MKDETVGESAAGDQASPVRLLIGGIRRQTSLWWLLELARSGARFTHRQRAANDWGVILE